MINIPAQLQKPELRFIKIKKQEKIPLEKDWPSKNNYKFDDPKILEWMDQGNNYGVVCGYGKLVVIDTDREEIRIVVENELPKTFTVKTGRGGRHFYFVCNDLNKPLRLREEKAGDLGDVQWEGKQVVGPSSIHPNGKAYEIIDDRSIEETSAEKIRFALKDFIIREPERVIDPQIQRFNRLEGISITDVINLAGLVKRGDEYYGPHPIHGSDGGQNFWVNTLTDTWHCFRCDSGGGPLQWLAVAEGIINCSDSRSGALDKEKFKKVLEIGKQKYNLKIPKKIEAPNIFKIWWTDKNDREHLNYLELSKSILYDMPVITERETDIIYYYDKGVYRNSGLSYIIEMAKRETGEKLTRSNLEELKLQIKSMTYKRAQDFDSNPYLVNLKNGYLNLMDETFHPHSKDILFLTQLPVDYDPKATCLNFLTFLEQVVSEEDFKTIQKIFGYCLVKHYKYHKIFMFEGEGANGKSTLLEVLKKLLGEENIAGIPLQTLEKKTFSTLNLRSKLANIVSDLPDTAMRQTGTFKQLTGEDTIFGEKKFAQDWIHFKNYAKLIFAMNQLPAFDEDTLAIWRRILVITFPNKFEGTKADKNIIDKLTTPEELSGILNWAIDGFILLEEEEFPDMNLELIRKNYILKSDPLKALIEEHVLPSPNGWIDKEEFYNKYVEFCEKHNSPIKDNNVVGREIKKHIRVESERTSFDGKRIQVWKGIDWSQNIDKNEGLEKNEGLP